jgi:glycosyltransferase involved in cell wall biosynthesis
MPQVQEYPEAAGSCLRVGILDHTAALGGGELALLHFVRRLDRQKFDPVVILFSEGPLRDGLSEAGVECRHFPLDSSITNLRKGSLGMRLLFRLPGLLASMGFVLRLSRYLKSQRIELVHANSLKSDILGGLAGRLAGVPVIWHVRDRIDSDYLPPIAARLFRILARIVPTHVITNSNATRETLRLRDSPGSNRLKNALAAFATIHDGTEIPSTESEPSPTSGEFLADGPKIGLVGRITPWKGQHIFIKAAAQVLKACPTAQFQIIGAALFEENDYEQEIRGLVETLGIAGSVQFLGFRTDVPELISQLHILVHASTSGEPFGQVIIEGMAAAKPVVATNGGGVPEIVVDGVTGILVPMGDVTAMAEAIRKLIDNPPLAAKMGQAGRMRAETCFDIGQTVQQIERVYSLFAGADTPNHPVSQTIGAG